MPTAETPLTLDAALAQTAARHPDLTAYVDSGPPVRSVTWGQLQQTVRDTAAGLIELGLHKGDRVAICAENSLDYIVAYMALTSAGAVGVLVYYELKPAEIREQVRRPESRFLIASADVLRNLGEDVAGVERVIVVGPQAVEGTMSLSSVPGHATDASRTALRSRAPLPDDLGVIIYTSGTTSGPKGVMLNHRNFMFDTAAAIEALDLSHADSALLVLPLHHAFPFIAAIVLPALTGARFIIENDIRRVRDRLQQHHPTVFFGVPALYDLVYRNLLARAESEGRLKTLQGWQKRLGAVKRLTGVNLAPLVFRPIQHALGGRLRFMVSGGAALSQQTARDFYSLGLPVIQGWGMTEAGPAVAVQQFSPRKFRYSNYYENHVGSVGPALKGVEVRLIDVPEKDIRVATAGEGEVIVRGPNVFRGYWNAPEATSDALVDGWLRTGDLARIDGEGNIYLTGRSKYVIVLESGEKVHPDELEENLARSDLVADVSIVPRRERDKTVVAAVLHPNVEQARALLSADGASLDEASLRKLVSSEVERVGRELAAYKRVTKVELSDEPLPKTPLRKVARGHIQDSYEFDFDRWLQSEGEEP